MKYECVNLQFYQETKERGNGIDFQKSSVPKDTYLCRKFVWLELGTLPSQYLYFPRRQSPHELRVCQSVLP